jgi:sodium-dependent phosphate cotransporter
LYEKFKENTKLQLVVFLIIGIYVFVCSLEGIKGGFKFIFANWQTDILGMVEGKSAPILGLAVGMLSTAIVQSSSAVIATTMVSMAGMVAGGLPVETAVYFGVPMVLGANIGTTITNTLVAFGVKQSMTNAEFKDVIPGVIVDDIYEVLTLSLFFPIEFFTGFISKTVIIIGNYLVGLLALESVFAAFETSIIDIIAADPLVKPLDNIIVSILGGNIGGVVVFVFWFLALIGGLGLMEKGLEKLIQTNWKDKVLAAFDKPIRGFVTGFGITWMVGSSSVGTSLVIPFLATKMVSLRKAYPYLVGCNLATTMDLGQIYGYLAGGVVGVMLGATHVLLNIVAVLLWFVSPLRFIPPKIAEVVGGKMVGSKNAAFSLLAWIILVFFILPLIIIYVIK